jgi:enoyl-CoA hydratase
VGAEDFTTIRYEIVESNIARITLDRPDVRNAQNRRMTYELNDAFTAAAFDDDVKVIVLAADGPHFSSGHDLKDGEQYELPTIGIAGGHSKPGAEGHMAFEEEVYFNMCRRWQQLPKPTIAQVQGKVIAGGLMLMWVCDLIVASDDATFMDPTVNFGVNGVEWFAHPWELGIRKAKELLFSGDPVSAADAHMLGMVNHVVPRDELEDRTLDLARKIAARPSFALKLAKLSCNQALDAQGFWTAQQSAFSLQHLGHSHNRERFGIPVDPSSIQIGAARAGGSS